MGIDRKKFEEIYAAERGSLERLATRNVGPSDAPDVVHNVFAAIWERAKDHLVLTPGYFVRATQLMAIGHFRADRRRARLSHAIVEEQYAPPAPQPDRIAAARQDLRQLQAALDGLPQRTRMAFLLNRLHQCTYEEIAVALAVSYSTVERDIARALMACKATDSDGDA
ncbi:RNA polymerase sigma factor [Azospirillum humicireducens]|uniref:RNA polymerase sigma factor n=1 Tax=Azospirillum humicireducens TaxID=1226968 RepID=UPI001304A241|nr:RNA polymerase sigma factor [Azospirillum humicireducens]